MRPHSLKASPALSWARRRQLSSSARSGQAVAVAAASATTRRHEKNEGTIASVFASLSGNTKPLPERFAQLKRDIIPGANRAAALERSFRQVLDALKSTVNDIDSGPRKQDYVPQIQYPGLEAARKPLSAWTSSNTLNDIRQRGVAVVRGVIPVEQALEWKEQVRSYIRANPSVKGFPEDDKQVFELYWSKAQLAARGDPRLMSVMRGFLDGLFRSWHQDGVKDLDRAISLSNTVSYADRLRIRHPGDAKFALGAHIDGGGVERWEDESFRNVWKAILEGRWQEYDAFRLGDNGEKLVAQGNMYEAPGGCSVYRPFQGWLALSETGPKEGTLRVLPSLQVATAYIILRPFFRPIVDELPNQNGQYSSGYLSADNWQLDLDSSAFAGCSLGSSLELNNTTHPHLELDRSLISAPQVSPGDVVLWHDSIVHAVESVHAGQGDSSVMYIPAIPLTRANFRYLINQRQQFEQGRPPVDFPGGVGESQFTGRGTVDDIKTEEARRAMGFAPFLMDNDMPELERRLIEECNRELAAL